jgi:membrane protease YdiL (CAAX protease family)
MTSTPATPSTDRPAGRIKGFAVRRPVLAFCLFAVGLSVTLMVALLIAGVSIIPGKASQLVILPGTALVITAWLSGRAGVRRLLTSMLRWRIGTTRWVMVLLALPALTLAVAAATGTLRSPGDGWTAVVVTYLIFLVLGAVTGNLWEETVWAGFVQGRLMAARGLLIGSLLTAVPFFLMHLPLAFEANGMNGTSWRDATIDWALILLAAPFLRYLIGTLLIDTGGSTLAAGIMHASFNAAGAMTVLAGGWQEIPALIVLTVAVAVYRARKGLPSAEGYAPELVPAMEPLPVMAA